MRQKTGVIIFILVLIPLLTGCWSRRELNTLGIVVGAGIDKVDNEYEVSVQIVNPGEISSQKAGSSGRAPVTVYSSRAETMAEAVRKLTTTTPRETYFSHTRVLILSEQVAKEGISKPLDYLSRDHEFRTDFYFVIARGTSAKQMLSFMTGMEKVPSNKIFDSLSIAEKEWSPVTTVRLHDLIQTIVSKGRNPVITGIRILGNIEDSTTRKNIEYIKPGAVLQTWGIAVFQEDRMVGWLDEEESKGFTDITDKLQRTVVKVACPQEGWLTLNVTHSVTRLKGRVVDGKPQVEVGIRMEANVSDVECKIELTKSETLALLEKEAEQEVKAHSEASVRKAKKLESDIFGFGEVIHRADPAYWNKVKDRWNQEFTAISVTYQVDVRIRRLGTINDSFFEKWKE